MKYLIFSMIIVLFAFCKVETTYDEAKNDTVTVSGMIENPGDLESVTLRLDRDKHKIVLVDGAFQTEVPLHTVTTGSLMAGRSRVPVYLEPGSDLVINMDLEAFPEGTSFGGGLVAHNDYIAFREDNLELTGRPDLMKMNEDDFLAGALENRKNTEAFLDAYLKENALPENFVTTQRTDIKYEWAGSLANYPRGHEYYAEIEDFEPSENYYDFAKKLDLNDDAQLSSSQFKNYLSNVMSSKAMKIMDEREEDEGFDMDLWIREQMNAARSTSSSTAIKEFMLASAMQDHLRYNGVDGVEDLFEEFKNEISNERYISMAQELYDQWAAIAKGREAPGWNYPDIKGQNVSLESMRGKYVYVDVWATWCGPCKAEIPHLEELEAQYEHNDNIIFTSISIDEDKEAWEKMVTEKEMRGVQLLADGAWGSSIVKDYLISGIPRFMLIDREGKIHSVNAPRPSSDKLKEMILELVPQPVSMLKD